MHKAPNATPLEQVTMTRYTFTYDSAGAIGAGVSKSWSTLAGAEKAAAKMQAVFADLGVSITTRAIELVSDGRGGMVFAGTVSA